MEKVTVLWKETGDNIAINCDVVFIRPYLPYVVKKKISNQEPLRSYEDLMDRMAGFRHNDIFVYFRYKFLSNTIELGVGKLKISDGGINTLFIQTKR